MTEANQLEVLPRFFHCSKQEAKEIAVEIALAAAVPRKTSVTGIAFRPSMEETELSSATPGRVRPGELAPIQPESESQPTAAYGPTAAHRTTVDPLTSSLRRLHLTVSTELLDKPKRAKAGQSHVRPGASDEQVIDAALDLLLAQQEKRKASVPTRVKRAVRDRDGRCCQWPTHDGRVCGSTVRLEIDHVVPRGRGGPSTAENCRVLCDVHDGEAARAVYGDAHMDLVAPRAREPEVPPAPAT